MDEDAANVIWILKRTVRDVGLKIKNEEMDSRWELRLRQEKEDDDYPLELNRWYYEDLNLNNLDCWGREQLKDFRYGPYGSASIKINEFF